MIKINQKSIVFRKENSFGKFKKIKEDNLPFYLYDVVKIGANVTFKRIFDLIIKHKELLNNVLGWGALHGHTIDMYIEEYNQPYVYDGDIEYLEVEWGCDSMEWRGVNDISLYSGLHGIGKKPNSIPYSIGFTAVNKLKELPFKINNEVKWYDFNSKEETLDKRYTLALKGVMEMKLIDMFNGILYEMTWFGGPKNRDKIAEDLDESAKNMYNEPMYEIDGFDDDGAPKFRELTKEEINELKEKDEEN